MFVEILNTKKNNNRYIDKSANSHTQPFRTHCTKAIAGKKEENKQMHHLCVNVPRVPHLFKTLDINWEYFFRYIIISRIENAFWMKRSKVMTFARYMINFCIISFWRLHTKKKREIQIVRITVRVHFDRKYVLKMSVK